METGRDRRGPRRTRARTDDPRHAEDVIAGAYLPNRVDRLEAEQLDLRLDSLSLRSSTVGLVSFGAEIRLRTAEPTSYHVDIPIVGQIVSRTDTGPGFRAGPDRASVFNPERPADIHWGRDTTLLCLMIPRSTVEEELQRMLGDAALHPLVFAPEMHLSRPAARGWRASLEMVLAELSESTGMMSHPRVAQHYERLMVGGLLLAQPHNYSEALARLGRRPRSGPVAAARELIEERPGDPWSTPSLAAAVHLSVRSLQEGFGAQLGVPPMTYLQQVRLRRARELLTEGSPVETTVTAVASSLGLSHRGRFASAYREAFAEPPSTTLRRE